MIINKAKKSNEVIDLIASDTESNKKYVANGYKIGGTVNNDKLKLYLNDSFNKHSNFMSMNFYGKVVSNGSGSYIKGYFRLAAYVIVLLSVLMILCLQSFLFNLIFSGSVVDMATPLVILCLEILYICLVIKSSKATNVIIKEYLNSL